MKRYYLILSVFALISMYNPLTAEAQYLNVYEANRAVIWSIELDNINKITFNETTMDVDIVDNASNLNFTPNNIGNSEAELSIAYEDVAHMDFGSKDVTTFVEEVLDDRTQSLTMSYDRGSQNIDVESTSEVKRASVFNIQGGLMQQIFPNNTHVSFSIVGYPAGIYIVNIATADVVKSIKIVKR